MNAAVLACIDRYTLPMPKRPARGPAGERLGSGVGASLEFQDYREYAPGDDLRHVDWAAYARRDELLIRMHREEIAPRLDIVVDTSRSMAATERKEARVREVVGLLFALARADRLTPRLWAVGARTERLDATFGERPERLVFDGPVGLESVLVRPPALAPRAMRIIVSDLLFPGEPTPVVRRLAAHSAGTRVVQVLDDDEAAPSFEGGLRLVDVESDGVMDLVVTASAVRDYVRRFAVLRDMWRTDLNRVGGALATVLASPDLDACCRGPLRQAGIVAVRGSAS